MIAGSKIKKSVMASEVNENSTDYVDFEGHTVRNYSFLQLSRIPRLDFNNPRVESMIANEVSRLPAKTKPEIIHVVHEFQ